MKNKEHCFQSIITIPPYQDGIKVCKLSEKDIDAMYAICISNPSVSYTHLIVVILFRLESKGISLTRTYFISKSFL